MKHVLVLVFSNLKHDARVMRQILWLSKNYKVTAVCFDSDEVADVTFIRIRQTQLVPARKAFLAMALALRLYRTAYWLFHDYKYLNNQLAARKFDIVFANDIDTLPLALFVAPNAKVIFDAHEYAPRHFENNMIWKIFFQPFYIHLCKKYIPKTTAMLTVGEGLANEYKKNFGVNPVIISNATRYVETAPSPLQTNRIRLIHHGIANPSRRLELMLEMMEHLDDRFTLDLILMTSDYASAQTKNYIEDFKERATKDTRIKILPAVKSHEVVNTINAYDIGVFLIPPINFNYANTLPNKLFDFIQARLGIAIGPTPEMAAIVNRYQNGVVAPDFEPKSLAAKLMQLTMEDVATFKTRSAVAAQELNAEKNEVIFNDLLKKLDTP
jgi:hypothetical protein